MAEERLETKGDYVGSSFDTYGREVFDRLVEEVFSMCWQDGFNSELPRHDFARIMRTRRDKGEANSLFEQYNLLLAMLSQLVVKVELGVDTDDAKEDIARIQDNYNVIYGDSPHEGIKTALKMPLLLACRVDQCRSDNMSWEEISGLIRSRSFGSCLTRLSMGINGSLGPSSFEPQFYGKLECEKNIRSNPYATAVILDEDGKVRVPKAIRDKLRYGLITAPKITPKERASMPPLRQDGCPMRRRYNGNSESLILYSSHRIADIIDILGSRYIPGFTPSIAQGDDLFAIELPEQIPA